MTKIILTVELEYDADMMYGDDVDAKVWFLNEILHEEDGLLLLHSNEIGDTVGKVRVIGKLP